MKDCIPIRKIMLRNPVCYRGGAYLFVVRGIGFKNALANPKNLGPIEAHAEQHGLLFKPKPGRRHDGHQMYAFGNLSVIIDALNQKVYAETEEGWSLVSLEDVVDKHHSSLS